MQAPAQGVTDMVPLTQLLIPIVLAAVAVFVLSALVHMVFKWHSSDFIGLPDEPAARTALKGVAPGQYFVPHCPDFKELRKPEARQKFIDGPVALIVVRPPAPPSMGAPLAQWFVLNLLVAVAVGYLASRTVPQGASFLAVCRVAGLTAFLAYAVGAVSHGIWFGKPWGSVAKDLLDSLLYGLATALVFAWLWPR
ncbi:MAG TPA: hypothetical protein VM073_06650 [Usitatibacter sp.]|nr:hypothetical protein [Usitatibacter sp.]